MPSEAESALLDASICLHVLALRGVVRSVMLVLAITWGCVSGAVDVCVCWLSAFALNGLHTIQIILH
jgi:hypothetical protein